MNNKQQEKALFTPLRGGSMGLVSGAKGGAAAGALGGIIWMGGTTAGPVWSIWIYTLILGLTTGMAAGAAFGVPYGIISGALSGRLLADMEAKPADTPPAAITAVWGVTAVLGGLAVGYAAGGVLLGGLAALPGAWISRRDFWRIVHRQMEPDETADEDEEGNADE